nr:MAG TPA: hypothetical protein [Caudoviricetes sp.]
MLFFRGLRANFLFLGAIFLLTACYFFTFIYQKLAPKRVKISTQNFLSTP